MNSKIKPEIIFGSVVVICGGVLTWVMMQDSDTDASNELVVKETPVVEVNKVEETGEKVLQAKRPHHAMEAEETENKETFKEENGRVRWPEPTPEMIEKMADGLLERMRSVSPEERNRMLEQMNKGMEAMLNNLDRIPAEHLTKIKERMKRQKEMSETMISVIQSKMTDQERQETQKIFDMGRELQQKIDAL